MPLISFKNLGSAGLIVDLAENELPLEGWTDAQNVRFTVLGVEKALGDASIYPGAPVEPYFIIPIRVSGVATWAYASAGKLYAISGSDSPTHENITRAAGGDYSAVAATKWSGGNFNGIGIFNNPVDVPQSWIPTSFATKATNLANWPAALRCKTMRPFRNYLVAMDLTNSGTNYPTAIRWSHSADPASVPTSWDITDETKDAGEYYFNETGGAVVELVPMRDEALLYKTDAIWGMSYIGGVFIWKFRKVSSITGIPCKNAAVEFKPGQHFIWTGDDLVVTDGQTLTSVADSRVKDLLRRINVNTYTGAFCVNNPNKSEVWFCFTEDSDIFRATTALIWNWKTGAWGERDLDNLNTVVTGTIFPSSAWDSDSFTWDSDTATWTDAVTGVSRSRLLGANATSFLYTEVGQYVNDATYTSYVERRALGIPFEQDAPPDISSWKFCREIWPRISGDSGTEIQVTIGTQTEIGGAVTWEDAQTFTIGTDVKLNCTVTGRMFALRFESTGLGSWVLNGYDLEVDYAGGY